MSISSPRSARVVSDGNLLAIFRFGIKGRGHRTVIAGTLGGWRCDDANPPTRFDGSCDLERLPIGHNYNLYAEPLIDLALPADFSDAFAGLCTADAIPSCRTPTVNTNFNVRILPSSQ